MNREIDQRESRRLWNPAFRASYIRRELDAQRQVVGVSGDAQPQLPQIDQSKSTTQVGP